MTRGRTISGIFRIARKYFGNTLQYGWFLRLAVFPAKVMVQQPSDAVLVTFDSSLRVVILQQNNSSKYFTISASQMLASLSLAHCLFKIIARFTRFTFCLTGTLLSSYIRRFLVCYNCCKVMFLRPLVVQGTFFQLSPSTGQTHTYILLHITHGRQNPFHFQKKSKLLSLECHWPTTGAIKCRDRAKTSPLSGIQIVFMMPIILVRQLFWIFWEAVWHDDDETDFAVKGPIFRIRHESSTFGLCNFVLYPLRVKVGPYLQKYAWHCKYFFLPDYLDYYPFLYIQNHFSSNFHSCNAISRMDRIL